MSFRSSLQIQTPRRAMVVLAAESHQNLSHMAAFLTQCSPASPIGVALSHKEFCWSLRRRNLVFGRRYCGIPRRQWQYPWFGDRWKTNFGREEALMISNRSKDPASMAVFLPSVRCHRALKNAKLHVSEFLARSEGTPSEVQTRFRDLLSVLGLCNTLSLKLTYQIRTYQYHHSNYIFFNAPSIVHSQCT